jgi:hypothetical protein
MYAIHRRLVAPLGLRVSQAKRQLDAGNWYGNDTAWRMAVDLFRAFHFADSAGVLHAKRQRLTFSVIDGIVGGENDGPLSPDAKACGILIGGTDFLATDLVATRIMGFEPTDLPMYRALLAGEEYGRLADIEVVSSQSRWPSCLRDATDPGLRFRPHPGWVGRFEIDEARPRHSQSQQSGGTNVGEDLSRGSGQIGDAAGGVPG